MKATHIDYQHPRHLRVESEPYMAWNITKGWYESRAMCLAPSHSDYAKLNAGKLPKWTRP